MWAESNKNFAVFRPVVVRRVLIVGAGIGGLALAILLGRQGVEPVVVERAASSRTIGFIVGFFPNGVRELERLGVLGGVLRESFVVRRFVARTGQGEHLWEGDLRRLDGRLPTIEVEREVLHRALLGACPVPIRYGTTLVAADEVLGGIRARLSDGTEETFDLLVGADGASSSTRQLVQPGARPSSTGYQYTIAWLPSLAAPDRCAVNYVLRGGLIGLYPACDGTRVGALFLHRRTDAAGLRAALHDVFGACGPRVSRLLEALPEDGVLFHRDDVELVLRRWHRGRVVLLGDAAHTVSPILGLGASLALEDASSLARHLGRGDPIEVVLRRFVRERLPRVRSVHRASRLVHAAVDHAARVGDRSGSVRLAFLRGLFLPAYLRWLRGLVAESDRPKPS